MKNRIAGSARLAAFATLLGASAGAQDCQTWLERFAVCDLNDVVRTSVVWDDGDGPAIYVGGAFTATGTGAFPLGSLARWKGLRWEQVGGGIDQDQTNHYVHTLAACDDGAGQALFVGGGFETVGDVVMNSIARWDGLSWSDLDGGLTKADGISPAFCGAMEEFDDGSGPALYVWGKYEFAGGQPAESFARWTAAGWEPLPNDLGNGSPNDYNIWDLAVFDDGTGPALYAAGDFETVRGHLVNTVAKWTGSGWTTVGGGFPTYRGSDVARALLVADLGDGPSLFIGGEFRTFIDGRLSECVAEWTGQEWRFLGYGLGNEGGGGAVVEALGVYEVNGSPRLFAAGQFDATWLGAGRGISQWDGFAWAPLRFGLPDRTHELQVLDRGDGDRLWAMGLAAGAFGVDSPDLIGWDGENWEAAGDGLSGNTQVASVLPFNDGIGPAIFAGTTYGRGGIGRLDTQGWIWYPEARDVARELEVIDTGGGPMLHAAIGADGTELTVARLENDAWQRVGETLFAGGAETIELFDDGSGAQLYCGGGFSGLWRAVSNYVTVRIGDEWLEMSGISDKVFDIVAFDDGSGEALYAAGEFETVNGAACRGVARWNGTAWECVGDGLNNDVYALEIFDDGNGPALYAGGRFSLAGDNGLSKGVAKWTGSAWQPLGDGLGGGTPVAYALCVFDDGSGEKLYVGGALDGAGGQPGRGITRWTGSAWETVGLGIGVNSDDVRALAVYDTGSGPRLAAAGGFGAMDGIPCGHVAAWDGSAWAPLGTGTGDPIRTLAAFDDGSGERLYAGGSFRLADGQIAYLVAAWDGALWHDVGSLDSRGGKSVSALAVFDDGSGPKLYAGGTFGLADGRVVMNCAAWDGAGWSSAPGTSSEILVLRSMQYRGAEVLGVGGRFGFAGHEDARAIARLDGNRWEGVPDAGLDSAVSDLLAFDDGTGPALYVGGGFLAPGQHVAKFDGSAWHRLSDGFDGWVFALEVFDDGSGPQVYAAGEFTRSGMSTNRRLARWDGAGWHEVGGGIDDGLVDSLHVHPGPDRPWLVATGSFTSVAGMPSRGVAAWDGSSWITFDPGLDGVAFCATTVDEGDGPALVIGGGFDTAGDTLAGGLAMLGPCPPPPCYADFNEDDTVNTLDVLAFLNAWTAGDPRADMNGDGSVNTLDVLAFLNYWTAGC